MQILIVTPLFPPDVAHSAQYTKELARRLSTEHQVTILLYGHLPESINGVTLVSVDKRRATPLRIWSFMYQLQNLSKRSDVILIQNGPSVELPCLFTLRFKKLPTILVESDQSALNRSQTHPVHSHIHHQLRAKVTNIYETGHSWPLDRPLIHPLQTYPEQAITNWEQSWNKHLNALSQFFTTQT